MKKRDYIVSTSDLMELFSVSRQTISNWKDQGAPKISRGKFDLKKIIAWRMQKIEDDCSKNFDDNIEVLNRLRTAQAIKIEMENSVTSGKYLLKADVINFLSEIFSNIRNKMLSSPNKIAFLVYGSTNLSDAKIRTRKIIKEFLTELSDPEVIFKEKKKKK